MLDKGKINVYTEIANNDHTRATGLMFRKVLAENAGMLFCFEHEDYPPFWMKNTYVPLDIAFINRAGRIVDIKTMTPLSTKKTMSSSPCLYALEVNAGWFKNKGIKVGDILPDIGEEMVTSQVANSQPLMLAPDFKTAVTMAEQNKWNLLVTYRFRPVKYVKGKTITKDFDKPSINDYFLILDGSVKLPSGRSFEYEDAGNGEFVIVPCQHSTGEARCFFVDGIIDFMFFYKGKKFIDPREIIPVQKKQKRVDFRKENPSLKGIPSIMF